VIQLRTLGGLDLRSAEGSELRAVLGQPKRIALLVYLSLAAPESTRRDTLLALFWPEDDEDRARNSLNQSVHVLRRALGEDVLVNRNGEELRVDPASLWCDAVAFEEALDANRLTDALDLYSGDLLEGFHVARAPEFERWLDAERARLARRFAAALESAARARQTAHDTQGTVALWRRLAVRDPYNSRVALELMHALVDAGDPAAAVQHARIHERLLRDEFGVACDNEIQLLVTRLQTQPGHRLTSEAHASEVELASPGIDVSANANPEAPTPRRRNLVAAAVLLLATIGAAAFLRTGPRADDRSIRSLAVLPFEDLSEDSTRPAFALAMHDALISELERYPDLIVPTRTTVLPYRGGTKPVTEIASDLKVEALIEGTVVRDGGRVRMTTRLVDGRTGRRLWSERYERDLRDLLKLQAELAQAIARQVRVAAMPLRRVARGAGPSDSSPERLYLRELYLRGRHAELSRNLVGLQAAKAAYWLAIKKDTSFAPAYAGLAAIYGFMADYRFAAVGPSLDSARIMARRAVALDSTLADARTALAVTLGDAHDFAAAESEFQRAIRLAPENARAHYWYSILLVALGRGEEALQEAKRAEELERFAPRGLLAMQRYAAWLVTADRPYRRMPVTERRPVLKWEPGEAWAHGREAEDLAEVGRCDEARSELERARQLAPDNIRMLPSAGIVYWWCGERSRARLLLEAMKRRADARENGFRMAILHTLSGEADSAFVWLEHQNWSMAELSALSADHYLDPLRGDPRLLRLMRRLGIR